MLQCYVRVLNLFVIVLVDLYVLWFGPYPPPPPLSLCIDKTLTVLVLGKGYYAIYYSNRLHYKYIIQQERLRDYHLEFLFLFFKSC